MIWWIIFAVFALFIVIMLKAEHAGRKVKLVFILVVLLLIYASVVGWFGSDKVDLDSPKGVVNSVYLYFGWIGKNVANIADIGKDSVIAVGNVIKGNQTNDSKKINDGRK